MIFSDALLTQLDSDATSDIVSQVPCIFYRFYLGTTAGQDVYTLPGFVKSVIRITWRGVALTPLSWEEMTLLTPTTMFLGVGNPQNVSTGTTGNPLWYSFNPSNIFDIKFYPPPAYSFLTTGDPYSPIVEDRCIVSCWRTVDDTNPKATLPLYINRRTRKAYILSKAFQIEGKGQSIKIAAYYTKKFKFLIEQFRLINEGCFVSKRYQLGENDLVTIDGFKYPKPTLNPNFERVILR